MDGCSWSSLEKGLSSTRWATTRPDSTLAGRERLVEELERRLATERARNQPVAGDEGTVAHARLPRVCPRLLNHDSDWHWRWSRRAVAFSERCGTGAPRHRALERLAAGYGRVVERLVAQPPVVIHGEFYPANVLVQVEQNGHVRRVCPVDWEMTAVGSALTDLAALCCGWSTAGREALATAYAEASDGQYANSERVLVDLDRCRLALAVQWLGWSPGWVAPAAQAHNWLAEALDLAQRLGV